MQTIGERARQNGMSVSDMLRVYSAAGTVVGIPLGPEEMRAFANFLEYPDQIAEVDRMARDLQRQSDRCIDATQVLEAETAKMIAMRDALSFNRRVVGWCTAFSVAATGAWLAFLAYTL